MERSLANSKAGPLPTARSEGGPCCEDWLWLQEQHGKDVIISPVGGGQGGPGRGGHPHRVLGPALPSCLLCGPLWVLTLRPTWRTRLWPSGSSTQQTGRRALPFPVKLPRSQLLTAHWPELGPMAIPGRGGWGGVIPSQRRRWAGAAGRPAILAQSSAALPTSLPPAQLG